MFVPFNHVVKIGAPDHWKKQRFKLSFCAFECGNIWTKDSGKKDNVCLNRPELTHGSTFSFHGTVDSLKSALFYTLWKLQFSPFISNRHLVNAAVGSVVLNLGHRQVRCIISICLQLWQTQRLLEYRDRRVATPCFKADKHVSCPQGIGATITEISVAVDMSLPHPEPPYPHQRIWPNHR